MGGEPDLLDAVLLKPLENAQRLLDRLDPVVKTVEYMTVIVDSALKKAAPDAKFRRPAEDRLAEMKAVADSLKVAEAEKKDSIAKAGAVEPVAAAPATPAPAAAPVASEVPVAEGNSIANANLLFKAGSFEAALQMYKALLNTEISPDERYFAMLQMGNIYRELRDFNSAAQRYRDVVQQFPDSDWATEAERALEDAVWLQKHASELPRKVR